MWKGLFPVTFICPSPLTAQLRALRLYFCLPHRLLAQAAVTQVLDLLPGIIPPDYLETLNIELLETIEDRIIRDQTGPILTTDALRPPFQYRRMVEFHLDLPCTIRLDLEFLHEFGTVMGVTLRHFVVFGTIISQRKDYMLNAGDLPTISGVILPQLETLGLDILWDIPSVAERGCLVVSSLLRTLYVGIRSILPSRSTMASFLKEHFPGLRYLHQRHNSVEWRFIMREKNYIGYYFKRGSKYCRGDW